MVRFILAAMVAACFAEPALSVGPKTVPVSGYRRKDGTYVRPYVRSAPGGGAAARVTIPAPPSVAPRSLPRSAPPKSRGSSPSEPRTEARSAPPSEPPASVTAVTISGFTAEVEGARVGRTMVGRQSPPRDFFIVRVKLSATAARVPYRSWGRGRPTLADSKGRELKHIADDGAGGVPIGRYEGEGVDRGGVRDVLLFDPPAGDSGELTLELPADCVDPDDAFIFVLQPDLWAK